MHMVVQVESNIVHFNPETSLVEVENRKSDLPPVLLAMGLYKDASCLLPNIPEIRRALCEVIRNLNMNDNPNMDTVDFVQEMSKFQWPFRHIRALAAVLQGCPSSGRVWRARMSAPDAPSDRPAHGRCRRGYCRRRTGRRHGVPQSLHSHLFLNVLDSDGRTGNGVTNFSSSFPCPAAPWRSPSRAQARTRIFPAAP